jgi:eukaryotic-like serine/threonine-protein kinase
MKQATRLSSRRAMQEDLLEMQPGAPLRGTSYRVVRRVGAGGMGAVFEIEHVRLKKRLIGKTLHPGLRGRDDFLARMDLEAQTLARLTHPNIVQVHDLGVTDDGIPFFVMEKLEGSDLRRLLRVRRFLELDPALMILGEVLEALAHAHREGVVHRDIKPENIFLARSGAHTVTKVLDFGIAHVMDDPMNLTGQRFLGTCQYAAPEQLRGQKPTEKTDIYAVGCVLFELITGRRPFPGPKTSDYVQQHVNEPAPRLSTFAAVPSALDELVATALEKDPAKRPVSALWFAGQIHQIRQTANDGVELFDANTTEEMLLTAITEASVSGGSVPKAPPMGPTFPDAGLPPALAATTPAGTKPMRTQPLEALEGPLRRLPTRTADPRPRDDENAETPSGAIRSSGVSSAQSTSWKRPLVPQAVVIAAPLAIGVVLSALILFYGTRAQPPPLETPPAATAPVMATPDNPQTATGDAPEMSTGHSEPAARTETVLPNAPAEPAKPTSPPETNPATLSKPRPSRVVRPATSAPANGGAPASAATSTAPPPPRQDFIRQL